MGMDGSNLELYEKNHQLHFLNVTCCLSGVSDWVDRI